MAGVKLNQFKLTLIAGGLTFLSLVACSPIATNSSPSSAPVVSNGSNSNGSASGSTNGSMANGSLASGSQNNNSTTLAEAVAYTQADAFNQDVLPAANGNPPAAPTPPVCTAAHVQDEITRVQDFISKVSQFAAGQPWGQCVTDLLNMRLKSLQDLLAEVQKTPPTESCHQTMKDMMAASGAAPAMPASCTAMMPTPPKQ
jgi:hypothetical protein